MERLRRRLALAGVGLGDRVGVRVPSGTNDLYVAILAVLAAGAAYVPVDAEDPDERAALVFGEAAVRAVVGDGHELTVHGRLRGCPPRGPASSTTPGSSSPPGPPGKPKGVAVSHRSAAAFVDAEAALFLTEDPIGPGDRVMAGLSVAFDASCEEMWLAWRYGACLVPVPRSQVRSGADLGPWLVEQEITVVSTVPTLAALWEPETLNDVRLLIFGGEACPPELTQRLVTEGREVWNTYGPTEATVVACASLLTGEEPIRIGLPLNGWELAVVDEAGEPVPMGASGQLVIGGVGLARYLDAEKDAEKYAPLESLGWERAYRSGDLVKAEPEGLVFLGRADEQIKLGGRRIELGEVDAALQALPGVAGAAAAVRTARSGNQLLVGYVVTQDGWDQRGGRREAARRAARGPRAAARAGRRAADPDSRQGRPEAPCPGRWRAWRAAAPAEQLYGTEAWLAEQWSEVLGIPVTAPGRRLLRDRRRQPRRRPADHPAAHPLPERRRPRHLPAAGAAQAGPASGESPRRTTVPGGWSRRFRVRAQVVQLLVLLPLFTAAWGCAGPSRWPRSATSCTGSAVSVAADRPVVARRRRGAGPLQPAGPARDRRGRGAAAAARACGRAGTRAAGRVHLRLWTAERLAEFSGATSLTGSWLERYARALGAKVGPDVDLHSLPPVTGMLKLGRGAAVESEVDLSGLLAGRRPAGDRPGQGRRRTRSSARAASCSRGPGWASAPRWRPGSAVTGQVPTGQRWAGAPAVKLGKAKRNWPKERPRAWHVLAGDVRR